MIGCTYTNPLVSVVTEFACSSLRKCLKESPPAIVGDNESGLDPGRTEIVIPLCLQGYDLSSGKALVS